MWIKVEGTLINLDNVLFITESVTEFGNPAIKLIGVDGVSLVAEIPKWPTFDEMRELLFPPGTERILGLVEDINDQLSSIIDRLDEIGPILQGIQANTTRGYSSTPT